ncbi:MAG TPA: DUF6448 family protein [Thermoanaerobaculia bacterium]|nr:DUF6448 family protein [Thermoanaerobaculia bacterium]
MRHAMIHDERARTATFLTAAILLLLPASLAFAHCDALDGPVVTAARNAIEKKDVTAVLKWVAADSEAEVRGAFARALSVRALSPEARDLADRFFFETVVRLHRAKEGEPFDGLKPAGTDPGPAVRAADRSIEQGSPDAAIRLVSDRAADAVRRLHARVVAARNRADESPTAGREFTAAYAAYVHFVETLYRTAEAGHEPSAAAAHAHP